MAGGEVAYFLCNAESGVQYAFVSMRAALGIPLKKTKTSRRFGPNRKNAALVVFRCLKLKLSLLEFWVKLLHDQYYK